MPVASIVSKRSYLARELVSGTRQPPNLELDGLSIMLLDNTTRGDVRPSGSTMSTASPLIQDWGTWSIGDGSYPDYNSLLYLLASLMGVPVTTTPGGGTLSREHAFLYASDGLNVRPTFTIARGYRGGTAEEALRAVLQGMGLTFSRTAAPKVTGDGYARNLNFTATLGVNEVQTLTLTPTGAIGGTFTLSYAGQTTAAIAFGATGATVQTALLLLSNLTPDKVSVAGPAGGPYVVTFGGTLANTDVVLMTGSGTSLTGPGSPYTVVVTVTQGGGITVVPVKAIQAPEWDVYLDPTPGAIGTTKVRPYSGEFNFKGLVNMDWVIDSTIPSYDDDVLQVPDLTANIVMRNDTTARALRPLLNAGATYYLRYKATGPIIEGALPYLLQLDFAVQAAANLGQFGDEGGSETMPFPLKIISDPTFASGGFQGLLRNTLSSL